MKIRLHLYLMATRLISLGAFILSWVALGDVFAASLEMSSNLFVECRGTVTPRQEWVFRPGPGLRVESLLVRTGQRIEKGHVIARVRDEDGLSRLCEMRSTLLSLDAARGEWQMAKLELDVKESKLGQLRAERKPLERTGGTQGDRTLEASLSALDAIAARNEDALRVLRSRVAVLEAHVKAGATLEKLLSLQVRRLEELINNSDLVAPFASEVIYVTSDPARIQSGERLLELWSTGPLLVRADVLQHQLILLEQGNKAQVTLDFASTLPVDAVVESVRAVPVPGEEVCPRFGVALALTSEVTWLMPGMKVSLRIDTGRLKR